MMRDNWNIKIFFDGACPLCSREMAFLRNRNIEGKIYFEDTSAPNFNPAQFGLSSEADRLIHAMLPDGSLISGLEVFRRVYKEVGLGWLLAPTGWPVLRPLCDIAYRIFAKNRKKIGSLFGSKSDSCRI